MGLVRRHCLLGQVGTLVLLVLHPRYLLDQQETQPPLFPTGPDIPSRPDIGRSNGTDAEKTHRTFQVGKTWTISYFTATLNTHFTLLKPEHPLVLAYRCYRPTTLAVQSITWGAYIDEMDQRADAVRLT